MRSECYKFAALITIFTVFYVQQAVAQQILTGILEHELTFGAENSLGEYRLSQTVSLVADEAGNIAAADAHLIKIFDRSGRGRSILGNSGEFSTLIDLFTAPSGYLTALSVNGYSVFSPDYTFLNRSVFSGGESFLRVLRQLTLTMSMPEKIVALNEREVLFSGEASGYRGDRSVWYSRVLLYDDGGTLRKLGQYEIMNKIWTGKQSHTVKLLGEFHWVVLPGRMIVYTHTGYDKRVGRGGETYLLHRKSLDGDETAVYEIPYGPVAVPDSIIRKSGPGLYPPDMSFEEVRNIFRNAYLKAEFLPPVRELFYDNARLFIVTYNYSRENGYFTDVVDTENGRYTASVYFPFLPAFIRNGRAYRIYWEEQKLPKIEVYRIDPVVYDR
ncbi:hypothetical protein ACFL6I_26965 [candidate division KSB1 bacterium]